MLAIPVFRSRVAPVLDWCSKIVIVPEEGLSDAAAGREIEVKKGNIFSQIRTLREQGIKTLICGALSPEMLNYGKNIGLRIIPGIAGDIEEVLQAYRERKLDQPKYWLPGCRGQRRYKGGARCAARSKDAITRGREPGDPGTGPVRKSSSDLSWDKATGGPGGFCVCPKCGSRKQHELGIPCSQVLCPACQSSMVRG